MQALKCFIGFCVVIGALLAIVTSFIVFGYMIKIIGFLLAILGVILFICYAGCSYVKECILDKKK